MNLMGHYLDHVTHSAGHKRRKRSPWRGPVIALLAVGVLVLRSVL